MRVRYESILILLKVCAIAFLLEWVAIKFLGVWFTDASRWSLLACFLTVEIGLNMSLWLRRVTSGLADRFKGYAYDRLLDASVSTGTGVLSQTTLAFLGECSRILGRRFERVTGFPGTILPWFGLLASVITVGIFLMGVPPVVECYLPLLIIPGLLYYLFVLLAYCDIVVQMDGVCMDLWTDASEEVKTSQLLPEVIKMGKIVGK